MGGSELLRHFQPLRVDVNGDDLPYARDTEPLDNVQPHPAGAEHGRGVFRPAVDDVDDRTHAGHHAAADNAGGGVGNLRCHFHQGGSFHQGVLGEGTEVEGPFDGAAFPERSFQVGVAGGKAVAAGHHRGVLLTDVLVAPLTLEALVAGRSPVQDDLVAGGEVLYAVANGEDLARAFVAHYDGLTPAQGVVVRMAEAGGLHAHQHLPGGGGADAGASDGESAVAIGNGGFAV